MNRALRIVALSLVCAASASATVTGNQPPTSYSCSDNTVFTIPWPYISASHVVATQTVSGVTSTVFGTVKPSIAPSTGTLTLPSACPSGATLTVSRVVPLTQPQSFRTGNYQGPIHEQAFDRLEMQVQQNAATHATDKTAQTAKDAAQDLAIIAAINPTPVTVQSNSLIQATGTTNPRTEGARAADVIKVRDFTGVVANDINDDTTGIQAAITQAAASSKALSFCPAATYRFSSQLVFSGVNVDFCNSNMHWVGAAGTFAMVLDSNTNSGTTGTTGNTFDNLTLYQNNFAAYVTATGSTTYDPPSIATGAQISNITPGGTSTTVTATGATVGGYARATFTGIVDGIELTARVTAPDTVTVTFSNYSNGAIDLPSGTLTVNVVNNAYHGLVLSGSLGWLRNAKVRGFTGVSVSMGNEIEVVSGVTLPGLSNAFYWKAEMNVTSAAGWPLIIPPRNNENEFTFGTFPANFYNESAGSRRATCINQIVIGGITNKFNRLSLETNASEEAIVILSSANMNETVGQGYIEYNTSWATPPFPRVRAKAFSSGNVFRFRHPYSGKAIVDLGAGNDISVRTSASVNGNQILPVRVGRNLVTNGDFENGLTNWSDFSTGGTFAVSGTGALSGKRIRADLTAGRPNLQQVVDTVGGFPISGLIGQNVTCNAFIKTNIVAVKPRLNGVSSNATIGDSTDEQISLTTNVVAGTTSLPLVIITDTTSNTGFVEVSNITCYLGTLAGGVGERTQPVGSKTFDPPLINAAAQATTTVTVIGAAMGDFAFCSFSLDVQTIQITGYVSAADTVTCLFQNGSAGNLDLASGTLRARVIKQ